LSAGERQQWLAKQRTLTKRFAADAVAGYMDALRLSLDELPAARNNAPATPPCAAMGLPGKEGRSPRTACEPRGGESKSPPGSA
jgi:hypothetical protein